MQAGDDKRAAKRYQNLIADTKAKLRAELAAVKAELDAIARGYAGLGQPNFLVA